MKWIFIIVGCLAALVAAAAIAGMFLPKVHTASKTLRLKQTPEEVWRAITDYAAMPSWRTDVAKIERLPDQNGHQV